LFTASDPPTEIGPKSATQVEEVAGEGHEDSRLDDPANTVADLDAVVLLKVEGEAGVKGAKLIRLLAGWPDVTLGGNSITLASDGLSTKTVILRLVYATSTSLPDGGRWQF
jgi:hypothetical protein